MSNDLHITYIVELSSNNNRVEIRSNYNGIRTTSVRIFDAHEEK